MSLLEEHLPPPGPPVRDADSPTQVTQEALDAASSTAHALFDVILILLLVGLVLLVLGRLRRLQQALPTVLSSLGILGTFSGIVIGLMAFQIGHIETSIGGLLAGLKTAFLTSLVGIAASISLKFLQAAWPEPKTESADNSDDVERLLRALEASQGASSAASRIRTTPL